MIKKIGNFSMTIRSKVTKKELKAIFDKFNYHYNKMVDAINTAALEHQEALTEPYDAVIDTLMSMIDLFVDDQAGDFSELIYDYGIEDSPSYSQFQQIWKQLQRDWEGVEDEDGI